MLKFCCFFSCFLALLFLSSCSSERHQIRQAHFQQWIADNGKLKVLSTTGMIDDLVNRIGGEHVDTMILIQGDLDPHSYQLVKGDDEKLLFAQLIFYSGLGLEHGPSLHHFLNENPHALSLGDQIARQYPDLVIDVNGQKDPHIWMDISLWANTVPLIVKALCEQDPAHAVSYEANGQALMAEMDRVHEQVKGIMHSIPSHKRYLVTSHDAFNYFARAYLSDEGEVDSGSWAKRFAAPEGLAPESQLSMTDIKAIIHHLKEHKIDVIFSESNVSRDSIKKIVQACQEEGHAVSISCCPLYGDAMGQPGSEGDSYLKMILYNAQTLAKNMVPSS